MPSLPGWYALVAPAKMDPGITRKLAAAVNNFLSDPATKAKLIDQFLFPIPGTSADIQRRAKATRRSGAG